MYRSVWENSVESGSGQPHSKTLARSLARYSAREVSEYGCPLPLYVNPVSRDASSRSGACGKPILGAGSSPLSPEVHHLATQP
jgi:hypothetical protein